MADPLYKLYLTAPWKKEYVLSKKKNDKCIFCLIANNKNFEGSWEIYRDTKAIIILNRFPFNPGHLLIIPLKHLEQIDELPVTLMNHLSKLIQKGIKLLKDTYDVQSFNIGLNQGEYSGASISHLHWHIVPRYPTDMNFMEILGTRTTIETLGETYQKLKENLVLNNKKRKKK